MKAEDRAKIEPEFNRALELWCGGDGQKAVLILEQLLSEYPKAPFILGVLGTIYRGLGDHERAVEYFQRTASLSPSSELASLGLFQSLWEIGKHEDAINEMMRFLSVASSEEYELLIQETIEDLDDQANVSHTDDSN